MTASRWTHFVLLTLSVLPACTPKPTPPAAGPVAMAGAAQANSADSPPPKDAVDSWADVSLEPGKLALVLASWDQTEQRIAKHAGRVVVVDFWSTWCTPCVREFPQLVKLQQQFPESVVCLSVNCNYSGAVDESAQDGRDVVLKFLTEKQATFAHVLCTDADTVVLEKIKAISVPVVRVYDKEGKLRKQFMNEEGEFGDEGFEYAKHIVPLVEQLLAE